MADPKTAAAGKAVAATQSSEALRGAVGTPLRNTLTIAKRLADLWQCGTRPRFHAFDFDPVSREIQKSVTTRYWQIVLKRLMLRAAEHVVGHSGCATHVPRHDRAANLCCRAAARPNPAAVVFGRIAADRAAGDRESAEEKSIRDAAA